MDFSDNDAICRLCLKRLTKNCEPIEEIVQYTLNFLTLCPDLSISDDPMICETCAANLKQCFDFKEKCLSTEDYISSFVEGGDKKADLREIYSKVKLDGCIDRVPDDQSACRFCLELVKDHESISVRHDIDLIEVLQKHFIEMDLKITDDIIACSQCYNSLRFYVSFVNNCMGIDDKINIHRKVKGANYKGLVDLREVTTFVSKNVLNVESISSMTIKEDNHESILNTNVDVKVNLEDPMDVKQEKEELVDKDIHQSNNNSFQHPSLSQSDHEPQLTSVKPSCETSEYQSNYIEWLQEPISSHKDPSLAAKYNCEICPFKTKIKDRLREHMVTHKHRNTTDVVKQDGMYKCEACTYKTDRKYSLRRHKLTHMDVSEVKMHKCELCSFKTKWEKNIKQHLLCHRDVLNVETPVPAYKCLLCNYESTQKSNLKRHFLTHKSSSEIPMYKCKLCEYEAKWKSSLKRHMLYHKPPKKIAVHKCEVCDFETKHTSHFKRHSLIHKRPSEVTMYKCNLCDYETRFKEHLNSHIVSHKTFSETTMYKCEVCTFVTKWKRCLQRHLLSHKRNS